MGKVVKFPLRTPEKFGNRRIRKKRKVDLEDFGQLNLFEAGKVVALSVEQSYFEQALSRDENNDPAAEQLYLKAIDKGESVEDAYCNLGVLKSAQKDSTTAIDFLTRCLQLNPRHFEAHYNLGNVYSDIGNLPLAKVHYELATQILPEAPNAYYNLGLVLISLKAYAEAIDCLDKYINLNPANGTETARQLITTLTAIA